MKFVFFVLFSLTSLLAQAQLVLNPAPSSGNIPIVSSQTYINITNSGSSAVSPSLTVDSNAAGISIATNRCGIIQPLQTCYLIISYPNYGVSSGNVTTILRNSGAPLSNLVYSAQQPVVESSTFSVSSLAMNGFSNYSFSIKNNTLSTKSYSPIIGGTDFYRYVIVLNRCSNIPPKGSCQVSLKLNRQFAGSYSATITEPQVTGSIAISSTITNLTVGVIPPPNPSISVSSPINFGTLTKLGQSAPQTVTITNTGNTNLFPVVSVEGSGLGISINRCSTTLVAPGKTCTVSLFFNAVSVMFNGAQSGLNFLAKATNATDLITTPVSVNLNVPPSLLISTTPSVTNPPYQFGKLWAGSYKTNRLSPTGDLYQTGGLGVLGSGYTSFTAVADLFFPLGTKFKFIASSQNSDYFCGISTTDETFCTDPYGSSYSYYSPDLSGTGGQYFKEVHPGFIEFDFCGLTNLNKVYCWGNNDFGNLGDGSPIPPSPTYSNFSNIPVEIKMTGALSGKTVKKLAGGVLAKCVIASDDKGYCWGYNANGELGIGTSGASVNEPTQIVMTNALAGKTLKDISSAANGFCALASDDKVYCWGQNAGSLTNTNPTSSSDEPIMTVDTNNVLSGKVINQLSAGTQHVCVIANDNKIYCWGHNLDGELGRGTSTTMSPPAQIDMLNFAGKTPNSISSGFNYSCATTTDNSLFCWGANNDNQLGIPVGNQLSPVLIPNGF